MAASGKRGELDGLDHHLDRIRGFPPLTRTEEHALALRARGGDLTAKKKLVQHSLALAVAVARRQRRGLLRLDDLIQEGSLGLMRAVESFDPHAGTRFSTYAVWWIRAYIGKYLYEARSAVRPRRGTVAQHDVSLDSSINDEDGPGPSRLEQVTEEGPSPEAACGASERDRQVRGALGHLRRNVGELGWDIIHNRLEQDSPETLEQIGRRWGLSRERVRQVEVKTREHLQRSLQPIHERDVA